MKETANSPQKGNLPAFLAAIGDDNTFLSVDTRVRGGIMDFRVVLTTQNGQAANSNYLIAQLRKQPLSKPINGTHDIAAFLALVEEVLYRNRVRKHNYPIFCTNETAINWLKSRKVSCIDDYTEDNFPAFALISDALDRISMFPMIRNVQFWDEFKRGGIPAEFSNGFVNAAQHEYIRNNTAV